MFHCSTMFMSSDCNIVLARGNYRYKHTLSLFVNSGSQIWLSFTWQLNGLCTPTKISLCTLRCRTELGKYKLACNCKALQTLQRAICVACCVGVHCIPIQMQESQIRWHLHSNPGIFWSHWLVLHICSRDFNVSAVFRLKNKWFVSLRLYV